MDAIPESENNETKGRNSRFHRRRMGYPQTKEEEIKE
jgi:hypothetical protein